MPRVTDVPPPEIQSDLEDRNRALDESVPSRVLDRSGYFDFRDAALPRRDLTNFQLSWRVSDHYPLWTEFDLD